MTSTLARMTTMMSCSNQGALATSQALPRRGPAGLGMRRQASFCGRPLNWNNLIHSRVLLSYA